jgi:hypothetical protein
MYNNPKCKQKCRYVLIKNYRRNLLKVQILTFKFHSLEKDMEARKEANLGAPMEEILEAHLENHRRSSVERHSGARVEADMETGVGPNKKAR